MNGNEFFFKKKKVRKSLEINGEVNEIVGRKGLVFFSAAVGNLLVAVNAVVVQHVQQQLLTEKYPEVKTKKKKKGYISSNKNNNTV